MPKRAARRSARRPSTKTARSASPPAAEWSRRWWNRITKTILTLGALAGAIAAILSLRPSPDLEDSARFTAMRVASQVPLSEYRQRSAAMVPEGSGRSQGRQLDHRALAQVAEAAWASANKPSSPAGLFAAVPRLQAEPTTSSQTVPATDTSVPESSSSDNTASSSTATSAPSTTGPPATATSAPSTTGPPATADVGILSSSVRLDVPPAFQQKDLGAYTHQVLKLAERQEPRLNPCEANPDDCTVTILPIIIGNSTDPEGNLVAPDVAAERVVKVLRDARTTGGGQPGGGQPGGAQQPRGEPLGVVVSADLELVGLRGKPVLLSWSMWQQGGQKRLFGNWLNRNVAFRLEATTDHDTTTLDLWVPLPKSRGPYFIRATLSAAGSRLAGADSPQFD